MQPLGPYATGASGLLKAFAAAGTGLLRFCAEALGTPLHDLAGSTSQARIRPEIDALQQGIADPPRVTALGSNLATRSRSANGRNQRILPVRARPGEGHLAEPIDGVSRRLRLSLDDERASRSVTMFGSRLAGPRASRKER